MKTARVSIGNFCGAADSLLFVLVRDTRMGRGCARFFMSSRPSGSFHADPADPQNGDPKDDPKDDDPQDGRQDGAPW
jgi:hypothetical protein